MERKTAIFGEGSRAGEVAYVIQKKTVYFTQISGVQSSINAAEEIVKAVSAKEKLNWKLHQWVDIQTQPRYSQYATDVLVFAGDFFASDSFYVVRWEPFEVPEEVTKIIFQR